LQLTVEPLHRELEDLRGKDAARREVAGREDDREE
jgi:hypothetical protein